MGVKGQNKGFGVSTRCVFLEPYKIKLVVLRCVDINMGEECEGNASVFGPLPEFEWLFKRYPGVAVSSNLVRLESVQ